MTRLDSDRERRLPGSPPPSNAAISQLFAAYMAPKVVQKMIIEDLARLPVLSTSARSMTPAAPELRR